MKAWVASPTSPDHCNSLGHFLDFKWPDLLEPHLRNIEWFAWFYFYIDMIFRYVLSNLISLFTNTHAYFIFTAAYQKTRLPRRSMPSKWYLYLNTEPYIIWIWISIEADNTYTKFTHAELCLWYDHYARCMPRPPSYTVYIYIYSIDTDMHVCHTWIDWA